MSTTTSKYKFIKPALGDPADITAQNQNWDKVETQLNLQNGAFENLQETTMSMLDTVTALKEDVPKGQKKITYGTAAPNGGVSGDV